MNLGHALEALKQGKRVARASWNGHSWIVFQKAYPQGIPINANTAEATGLPLGTVCAFDPYVMVKTAEGSFAPWVCSQKDLLAEDWEIASAASPAL